MKNIFIILLIIWTNISFSQQAIGTNAPDASAALDVSSTNKGVLIPRIALTGTNDVTTISTPQTSLMVYNTATVVGANAITPGFHYFDGTSWIFLRDANHANDSTTDFWIDSTYVRGGNTIMQIRDNGNVEIGLSNKIEIINRQISSGGAGLRELFRVPNNRLATSGIFSVTSTRTSFVHSSNWSWTSNHQSTGKGMLTKLSGSDYVNNITLTNIPVYIDVASNGDAIISANWSAAQAIGISILKLSGGAIDLTNTGTLWSSPNAGYVRADSVFTKQNAFQTRDGLFSGNVGIGETNPNVKLHIKDSVDGIFNGLIIDNRKPYGVGEGANETSRISLSLSENGAPASSRVMGYIEAGVLNELSSANSFMAFGTRSSTVTSEKMRILNNGNLGIGTTTPSGRLTVSETDQAIHLAQTTFNYNGTTPIGMQLGAWGGSYTNSAGIKFNRWSGGTPHYSAYVGQALDPLSNKYGLDFKVDELGAQGDATSSRMFIKPDGNVGIGTTNPSERLEVVGKILASGTITPSDKRYKENINTLDNTLNKVLQLRGVSYNMKKEYKDQGFGEGLQIGVIAQEIEKIYPELVNTNKASGYKGVDYSKLTPILIEATKEQQVLIDTLKEENRSIKKELAEIKALLLKQSDK